MLEGRALEWLLEDLCAKFGFCLPADKLAPFRASPPADAESFTAAIFRAEGLDPLMANKSLHHNAREYIEAAIQRAAIRDA